MSQKRNESSLFEVMIGGQGFVYRMLLHDDKRNAIGNSPLFIKALLKTANSFIEQPGARRDDLNGRI